MSFCGRNLTDKDYAELVHDLRTIDENFGADRTTTRAH